MNWPFHKFKYFLFFWKIDNLVKTYDCDFGACAPGPFGSGHIITGSDISEVSGVVGASKQVNGVLFCISNILLEWLHLRREEKY